MLATRLLTPKTRANFGGRCHVSTVAGVLHAASRWAPLTPDCRTSPHDLAGYVGGKRLERCGYWPSTPLTICTEARR